ncbi:hypothetical protein [Cohnella lupini]|uniref:Uncharacterized protein n=1 Tax=Cohnella lupini TaxID=1294267 RepID=A0A3D9IJ75_9BACL|nr:hypothetical protein [Cohnella lupini]RED61792.1 hypothetical protein DFP95_105221 [Cohnella lupini]
MSSRTESVPYGYEPPKDGDKGTLIYYDTFETTTDEQLERAIEINSDRSFAKLVLYPIHEETMRRMSKKPTSPYYKREKRLLEWKREYDRGEVEFDGWEGKRKKYTPMEAALRHLTETLPGPHFLFLTPDMANSFASFSSFEEWIVKVRLILTSVTEAALHPRLERYRHRWDWGDGE